MSTYDDGYYITIETVVERPERAIMTLLSVSNAGDLFMPGTHESFTLENDGAGRRATMLGCVGDDVGIYNQYDKPADELDVLVSEPESGNENELDVTVEARWFDRDQYGQRTPEFQDAVTEFTIVR